MRQSLGRCTAPSPAEAPAAPSHASSAHHHANHARHLHSHVVSASEHASTALPGNVLPLRNDCDLTSFEETIIVKLCLHSRILALKLNIGKPIYINQIPLTL